MAEDSPIQLLSDAQRKVAAFSLTLLAAFGAAALFIAAFVVLGRLLGAFSSVIWPVAVAAVLALILRPVVDWIEAKLRVQRLLAVILLYASFLLAVAGVLLLILPPLVEQTLEFFAYLPTLWDHIANFVQQHYPQWSRVVHAELDRYGVPNAADLVAGQSKAFFTQALPSVWKAFGGIVDAIGFVTHVVIIPVYLFFFLQLRGAPMGRLGEHLSFLKPTVRDDVVFLASEFVSTVESFFRGQLLIGFSMGVLYAAGFSAIGLKFGMFIGLALGLLNVVPYLGTILGLVTALPLALFQSGGGWELVLLVLLVKGIVQCAESWVLTPKIMGDRTGLHPAAIIFAVFFWGTAFHGVLGMILAVPLTAFFVTAWRLAKRKYLRG